MEVKKPILVQVSITADEIEYLYSNTIALHGADKPAFVKLASTCMSNGYDIITQLGALDSLVETESVEEITDEIIRRCSQPKSQ